MPTPADQRLLELLDKWLSSLDLHLKYSSLDDDSYWKIQPWVEHQRPSRWIIDLARQKTLALRKEVSKRMEAGDAGFSDALELMTFLANLVGSQHIERFIPLADPQSERYVSGSSARMMPPNGADETREMPRAQAQKAEQAATAPDQATATPNQAAEQDQPTTRDQPTATQEMLRLDRPNTAATATREMPRFALNQPPPAAPVATRQVARVERRQAQEDALEHTAEHDALNAADVSRSGGGGKHGASRAGEHRGAKASHRGASRPSDAPPPVSPEMCEQIIADAARLMQWGRKWYELAELISRMADRPPLPDVRRVLKDQKANIERLAGR